MIGQFSVGFYSIYLVTDKVEVLSKHNEDNVYAWASKVGGSFTISKVEDSSLKCSTRIVLHIKEDMSEYLEKKRVTDLMKKHSKFIRFPIKLYTEKTTEKEVTNDEEDNKDKDKDNDENKPKVEDVEEEEAKG